MHSSLGVATGGYSDLYPDTVVDSGSLFRAPIDPDLKGAYTDEAVVGFDWEFLQGWKGGVKLIKRDLGSASGEFAPRFGATWDVLGEGRSKLYGSWGRYYDSIPMQVVSRAFSPRVTSTRLYRAENWSQTGFLNDIRHNGICPVNDPIYDAGSAFHKTCWDFESAD